MQTAQSEKGDGNEARRRQQRQRRRRTEIRQGPYCSALLKLRVHVDIEY